MAQDFGVRVRSYRADNVPFGNDRFKEECRSCNQTITFSGVGAQHENGVAERGIQTIMQSARAMMMHTILSWPDQANLSLWPFAVDHAVYLWNHTPKHGQSMSPVEIFSGVKFADYSHLASLHVFGAPVYVLDPKLQDGKRIPKWSPRARRGQFLGRSPDHASFVGLVRNLDTGYVSPQYHVVYDDLFSTVPNAEAGSFLERVAPFGNSEWNTMLRSGVERYIFDEVDDDGFPIPLPQLADQWLTVRQRRARARLRRRRAARLRDPAPAAAVRVAVFLHRHDLRHGTGRTVQLF
mgnify:CR=1 FL=1